MLLTAGAAFAEPSQGDIVFLNAAAQNGMAEVQQGQLAMQKATTPQVRQFGERLVDDHAKISANLAQIAHAENLPLPGRPSDMEQTQLDGLNVMTGPAFDHTFVSDAVQDHEQAIAMFKNEAEIGQDPALRAFAQSTLPVLQSHLEIAAAMHSGE